MVCNMVKMVASIYEMVCLERLAVCRSDTNSFGLPFWEVILNMLGRQRNNLFFRSRQGFTKISSTTGHIQGGSLNRGKK
jgi:hypothetical protein